MSDEYSVSHNFQTGKIDAEMYRYKMGRVLYEATCCRGGEMTWECRVCPNPLALLPPWPSEVARLWDGGSWTPEVARLWPTETRCRPGICRECEAARSSEATG